MSRLEVSKGTGEHPRNKRHPLMQYATAWTCVKACPKPSSTPDSAMNSKHRMRDKLDSNNRLNSTQTLSITWNFGSDIVFRGHAYPRGGPSP